MPVVVIDDVDQAVPLARALARGGVGIIEITLRTAAGIGAIERVAAEVPEIVTGAGTVTTPEGRRGRTARRRPVHRDPGLTAPAAAGGPRHRDPAAGRLVHAHQDDAPGRDGLSAMKFFPAEASGGRGYLSAVAGPLPGLRFCPTGGISMANAADYLALPNVGCVGGSWLTPKDAVAAGDWGRTSGWPARRPRCAADRVRAWNSPRAPGWCRGAMDESHRLAGCGGLQWIAVHPCRPGWRTRGGQWNRLASAQPPHTSVGYSLGGPPPFLVYPRPYVAVIGSATEISRRGHRCRSRP